ncbi:response regulator containing a CheY-like receiver domain and a GGDEF domain [Anaerolinea thermolimosa]|uniref:response regulator n=1 Tax=Anaerolinea thermolimosa TaxID=229919 RepID=UPI0009FE780E|nr:response regulator [Anaerolinea thermolimosa]GAP05181.1 response regulator containing a CheY-like receiver domain and a GGDEF domain [Anaerolinea thermolimosa]
MEFEQFLLQLRGVLNHLYDPDYLRRSPLAAWFGVSERYDTPLAIQRILMNAIEDMRPDPQGVTSPIEQQNYDVLLYRYIQQSSQREVAHQLGVSDRQLRRIQAVALEMLATRLWKHCPNAASANPESHYQKFSGQEKALDDFAWLKDAPVASPADPIEIVRNVVDLLQPLASRHHVTLGYRALEGLPHLAVQPVALRQVLLSLLGDLIRVASGCELVISLSRSGAEVIINIGNLRTDVPCLVNLESQGIRDAHQITAFMKGRLLVVPSNSTGVIQLFLPAVEQIKVLVVDDNRDIVELMRRFTEGTRFTIRGVHRAEAVLEAVVHEAPQIILLDVMIPEVDGWELLGKLRRNPQTAHIPVIICTILAQKELAMALGAEDFIQKPVHREVLLQALERVEEKLAKALQ